MGPHTPQGFFCHRVGVHTGGFTVLSLPVSRSPPKRRTDSRSFDRPERGEMLGAEEPAGRRVRGRAWHELDVAWG